MNIRRNAFVGVVGGTWENADLGPKLPGRDVWRQWRFQWKPRG